MESTITLAFILLLTVCGGHGLLDISTAAQGRLQQNWKKSFHEGYQAAIKEHFQKNEKRYDVATLNQAARNRNPLLSNLGGDPYGMGSTVLSTQHVTFGRKKRSVANAQRNRRYFATPANLLKEAYASGYAAGKEVVAKMQREKEDPEKRFSIEKLNQAARHRNVYLDAVGGDPYGGSSVVGSKQHVNWHHGKRSVTSKDEDKYGAKTVRRLLRRVVKMSRKKTA